MKRAFDIFFSITALLFLWPFILVLSLVIFFGSKGGVFYKQIRIGKNFREFHLLKFRTMRPGSDKQGLITVGGKDNRITKEGYFLRKYKLDELPQFINILKGDMSFVGPRPEVKKYVDLYHERYKNVLSVRPGLTDYASLEYIDENEILGKSDNPEKTYTNEILPHKIDLADKYVSKASVMEDIKIIMLTLKRIISG
jgi:lipopolysaccharide/colanic/teichoic acid biosynthesis glycosyltransferase